MGKTEEQLSLDLAILAGDIVERVIGLADGYNQDRQDLLLFFLSLLILFCENGDFSKYLTEQQQEIGKIYS